MINDTVELYTEVKQPRILTTANTKIRKGEKQGYMTVGIHFAPASLSGYNVCPAASAGCRAACLNLAGQGRFPQVQRARIAKTRRFFEDREAFMEQLVAELAASKRQATRKGLKLAVRLNLTSDVQWENVLHEGKTIYEWFPEVQFYGYTKVFKSILPGSKARSFPNNHITFSRSESNEKHVAKAIELGVNVAVVFDKMPLVWNHRPVVSGDNDDLRFLDPRNSIVGLVPKGKAKGATSGFVVKGLSNHAHTI